MTLFITISTEPLAYNIGKHNCPDLFPKFQMLFDTDQTELALKRDIAWSLCGVLNDDDLSLLGSWTFFSKLVSNIKYETVVQKSLPVNTNRPDYPIDKEYLDFFLEVIDDWETRFIYVHSDELIYSKLCEIFWKNKDTYTKIIILMGGLHQLKVMQQLLCKRYVDVKTIAEDSIDQAF